ncbi:MAG: hypothetical protein SOR95_08245 [Sutterella sp.]|nr:hypothetical protein [Sutterella sp.]
MNNSSNKPYIPIPMGALAFYQGFFTLIMLIHYTTQDEFDKAGQMAVREGALDSTQLEEEERKAAIAFVEAFKQRKLKSAYTTLQSRSAFYTFYWRIATVISYLPETVIDEAQSRAIKAGELPAQNALSKAQIKELAELLAKMHMASMS